MDQSQSSVAASAAARIPRGLPRRTQETCPVRGTAFEGQGNRATYCATLWKRLRRNARKPCRVCDEPMLRDQGVIWQKGMIHDACWVAAGNKAFWFAPTIPTTPVAARDPLMHWDLAWGPPPHNFERRTIPLDGKPTLVQITALTAGWDDVRFGFEIVEGTEKPA